jgi:hypothetical protein
MRFKNGLYGLFATTLVASLTLTACSGPALLGSLKLGVIPQLAGNALSLSGGLNLGNLVLGNLQTPILDPLTKNLIGTLNLGNLISGGGTRPSSTNSPFQSILLNLSPGANLAGSTDLGLTLPNGKPLPESLGVAPGEIRGIPLLNQSRVYIGGSPATRMIVGVALTLKEFDTVSANLPLPTNAFVPRSFGGGTRGLAGLYTSPLPGQSGVALFAVSGAAASTPSPQQAQKNGSPQISGTVIDPRHRAEFMKLFYGKRRIVTPQ